MLFKDYQGVFQGGFNMQISDKYATLYRITLALIIGSEVLNISKSDLISITFIHQYDQLTYPIIRIRLYSDIEIMELINNDPDNINIRLNMDAGVYKINENENKSPVIVSGASPLSFSLKGYVETKNTPVSISDMYVNGEKRNATLNESVKVPIEIYCYNETLIHHMKYKPQSIYKNMCIQSVVEDILSRNNIRNIKIDPFYNQEKFDQVLIPNLNIGDTIAFFDDKYGLYPKGGQLYGDIDQLYIANSDVDNGEKPLPIYVESYKSNSNMMGLRKISNGYYMSTMAQNVSIISETEIEKTLRSEDITNINLSYLSIETNELQKLYAAEQISDIATNISSEITTSTEEKITLPTLFDKTKSKYHTTVYEARINERITRVDVSGVGFDIGKMKVNTRYNLIFESAIRGSNINQSYRATFINHVITNLNADLFVANTTMTLCSN